MRSLSGYSILVIVALFSFACGEGNKNKNSEITIEDKEMPAEIRAQKAIHDEVIAIHDEVMPRMDEMMKLKGQLQVKLDMAREKEGPKQLESLQDAILELEKADEAMMQWMRDFSPREGLENHEEIMAFYEKEKVKITEVKEKILESMERARGMLQSQK